MRGGLERRGDCEMQCWGRCGLATGSGEEAFCSSAGGGCGEPGVAALQLKRGGLGGGEDAFTQVSLYLYQVSFKKGAFLPMKPIRLVVFKFD